MTKQISMKKATCNAQNFYFLIEFLLITKELLKLLVLTVMIKYLIKY